MLVSSVTISCEEDFTDIKSGVVSNTKFSTGEVVLDLEISTINIDNIAADNIGLPRLQDNSIPQVDYWLGIYKNANAKNLEAGFVSQLGLPSSLKNSEDVVDRDTIYNLDKVVLKIPYTAVSLGKNTNGITTYRLDSILGNTSALTAIDVYRNPTFLNVLNPSDPSKQNSYLSNFDYQETKMLSEAGFSFKPRATDTIFRFDRIDRSVDVNSTTTVKDTLKVLNTSQVATPFLAIPLNLEEMKTSFWNKFNDTEFSSSEEFQKYFRGIIVKAKGVDGALIPFNLSNSQVSVDFLYSKTVLKDMAVDTVIKAAYSFPLGGIKNTIYKTESAASTPANSFVVQGTTGLSAEIKVLGVNLLSLEADDPFLLTYGDKDLDNNNYIDLEELAAIRNTSNNEFGFLINDADLTFGVNNTLSTNSAVLPQRLYVYQNKDNGNGVLIPTHLTDSYEEAVSFNGNLVSNDNVPQSYSFKITDYISDLMDGSSKDFSPLALKVYNTTDNAILTGALNRNVFQYNWNPRAVVLFDEDGTKKARLKLSYTKKKN